MAVTGYIEDEFGNQVCDTNVCHAVCCRSSHFRPDKNPPCEYLTAKSSCELHDVGGMTCKPMGCAEFPRNQADIDEINKQAALGGFTERCLLRVE